MILRFTFLAVLTCLSTIDIYARQDWQIQSVPIQTRWAKEVSPANALTEYPRPQMIRAGWQNLNGLWEYAITPRNALVPEKFDGKILVPYPVESALSGVRRAVLPNQNLWYKRTISKPALKGGERLILNFGAVDWQATIYVNGKQVGQHSGGYQSFSFDITDYLRQDENVLTIKVYDPTDQGPNPHGKQVLRPENIYYTPSTGIWQTVWMEVVPEAYIASIRQTPDINKNVLHVTVSAPEGYKVSLSASADGERVSSVQGVPGRDIVLPIKNAKLWTPERPFLYDLQVQLTKKSKAIDEVKSYFGMRKIEVKKDNAGIERIYLNNQYIFNLGTLDQGFWPEGLLTAPTDEALAFDIKAIKAMGFNTIRKHIKIEPARWYYHCDRLGMLVWQDFVNPPHNMPEGAKEEFEKEVLATMEQLHNHPCITTWVLFNEKWGSYDQKRLTERIKKVDPSRLVNGHSGEMLYVNDQLRSPSPNAWVSSDMTDVHSYPDPMNAPAQTGKARVLGEFGGIGVFIPDHQWNTSSAWGYIQEKPASLQTKYTIMNQHIQLLEREGLSGSIYTQPFDVEGEQNGLITYDREVIKVPFEELRRIHQQLVPVIGDIPSVAIKIASMTDPAVLYSQLLQQFIDGKREPVFLQKITMMAQQAGDKAGASRLSEEYICTLKAPYTKDDLEFMLKNTNKVADSGFSILQRQIQDSSSQIEKRLVVTRLMNVIFNDLMEPSLRDPSAEVDWNGMEAKVKQFGEIGDEIFLRAQTIYYLNKQDWERYAIVAKVYIERYGKNLSEDERRTLQDAIERGKKT